MKGPGVFSSLRCTCRWLGSDLGSGGQGSAAEEWPAGEGGGAGRSSGEGVEGQLGWEDSREDREGRGVFELGKAGVEGMFRGELRARAAMACRTTVDVKVRAGWGYI